jgi:hypothetical protein
MNHLITKKDLFHIISDAKTKMSNLTLPMEISGKEVEQTELATIAIAESLIMYFNANKLFTNLPQIDYTDTSCKFEPNEE